MASAVCVEPSSLPGSVGSGSNRRSPSGSSVRGSWRTSPLEPAAPGLAGRAGRAGRADGTVAQVDGLAGELAVDEPFLVLPDAVGHVGAGDEVVGADRRARRDRRLDLAGDLLPGRRGPGWCRGPACGCRRGSGERPLESWTCANVLRFARLLPSLATVTLRVMHVPRRGEVRRLLDRGHDEVRPVALLLEALLGGREGGLRERGEGSQQRDDRGRHQDCEPTRSVLQLPSSTNEFPGLTSDPTPRARRRQCRFAVQLDARHRRPVEGHVLWRR